jgi:hypothetical protein
MYSSSLPQPKHGRRKGRGRYKAPEDRGGIARGCRGRRWGLDRSGIEACMGHRNVSCEAMIKRHVGVQMFIGRDKCIIFFHVILETNSFSDHDLLF